MIRIICFGRIKEKYLEDLITDYQKRISKYHKIEIIELKDTNDLEEEARTLKKYLHPQDYVVALDLKGEKTTSVKLASFIESSFNYYSTITFIIGSSNGLDDSIKKESHKILSFSDLTFPHGLFRGLLLEQIYRSFKIINNEKYHK